MHSRILRSAALLLSGLFALGQAAWAEEVLYREVFPNQILVDDPAGDFDKNESFVQGWFGEQHGSTIVGPQEQDLQILDGNPSPNEPDPVESDPQGPLAPNTGGVFYSPAARAGIYIFTDEFQLLVAQIDRITWESRSRSCNDNDGACSAQAVERSKMRLALKVDGQWYISDDGLQHLAGNDTWQDNGFDFTAGPITFGTASFVFDGECDLAGDPRCLPRSDGNSGLTLPDGTVEAFGIYVRKNEQGSAGNPTMRFDNYTIWGRSHPCDYLTATSGCRVNGVLGTCRGTGQRDLIIGTDGRDVIFGRGNDDVIFGLDKKDVLCGDGGDDWLIGGNGGDVMSGDGGDDILDGNRGRDDLDGGPGNDKLDGGPGNDTCTDPNEANQTFPFQSCEN